MARVITFSRTFPSYHPKAGQPTYFVEKIWKGMISVNPESLDITAVNLPEERERFCFNKVEGVKHHTIRAGNRWKVGDKFSPRVWGSDVNPKNGKSGPYNSKQIIIAPDMEVKKVWRFEMKPALWADECTFRLNGKRIDAGQLTIVAQNDGLQLGELVYWFAGPGTMNSKRKPFTGQIICWNENIKY